MNASETEIADIRVIREVEKLARELQVIVVRDPEGDPVGSVRPRLQPRIGLDHWAEIAEHNSSEADIKLTRGMEVAYFAAI